MVLLWAEMKVGFRLTDRQKREREQKKRERTADCERGREREGRLPI